MTRKTEPTSHEIHCLENAEYFTAVRGRGLKRTRVKCNTIQAAEAIASDHGDGRTMIYAVTTEGSSAHIKSA